MNEIWLQANRRAALGPGLGFLAGAVVQTFLAVRLLTLPDVAAAWGLLCLGCAAFSIFVAASSAYSLTRPRLRYDGECLLIDVGTPQPARVPVELVEGFLIGKGPTFLTGRDDKRSETSTLTIRLAERAPEFEKMPTNVRVAAWCGHYVTLRGTWTEPISLELVNRLNQRLHDAQQVALQAGRAAS